MSLWEKTFICNNCMGFPASKRHGTSRWIPAVFSTGPSILKKLSTYSLKQNKTKPKPNQTKNNFTLKRNKQLITIYTLFLFWVYLLS